MKYLRLFLCVQNVEVVDYPAGVKHQLFMKYLRLVFVCRMWKWLTFAAGVVAVTSIGINVALAVVVRASHRQRPDQRWHHRRRHGAARHSTAHSASSDRDTTELLPLRGGEDESSLVDSSDEVDEETKLFDKRSPRTRASDRR